MIEWKFRESPKGFSFVFLRNFLDSFLRGLFNVTPFPLTENDKNNA